MRFLSLLTNPKHAETAAFAATLFCLWLTAQLALKLPHRTPRVFTAACLFALNWGILLLYYLPGPPQDEILAAFSGFVLIYVGILLLREGVGRSAEAERAEIGWLETVPLHLLRLTVLGYGVYLVLHRLFRLEYGFGTLALALWGTLLTVLGYLSVWAGVVRLYHGSPAGKRAAVWLGALLVIYSLCEFAYVGWYAHDYWPVYSRYLTLQARADAPDFERSLPVEPQADWPEYGKWTAWRSRPDWPAIQRILALEAEPRVPDMWLWLKYAFSALKILFTAAFLILLWRRPEQPSDIPRQGLFRWLDRHLKA